MRSKAATLAELLAEPAGPIDVWFSRLATVVVATTVVLTLLGIAR